MALTALYSPISPYISLYLPIYLPISPYISQVALTALYTALGGLAAVIVTDVAQSVLPGRGVRVMAGGAAALGSWRVVLRR